MVNLTNNKLTKFPLNALTLDTSQVSSSEETEMGPIKINGKNKSLASNKKWDDDH